MRAGSSGKGFILLEQLLALMVFASVGVALATALNEIGRLAFEARREAQLARILDSELRAAMSLPNIQELEETKVMEEMDVEVTTIVQPIEEMENQEGQTLARMWLVRVEARWWENNDWQERSAETWRYGLMYAPQ